MYPRYCQVCMLPSPSLREAVMAGDFPDVSLGGQESGKEQPRSLSAVVVSGVWAGLVEE